MNWRDLFCQILKEDYQRLKNKNTLYSQRAYAQKLKISTGSLSYILQGKPKISSQQSLKIIQNLNHKNKQINRLLFFLEKTQDVQRTIFKPEDERYKFLSDWRYQAIIYYFDTVENKTTAFIKEDLKEKFGFTSAFASKALSDLIQAKFLTLKNNKYERHINDFVYGDSIPSSTIREAHKDNLELMKDLLEKIPAEKRGFSYMTFAGDAEDVDFVRSEIRKFQNKIYSHMSASSKKKVFRLSVFLTPIELAEVKND